MGGRRVKKFIGEGAKKAEEPVKEATKKVAPKRKQVKGKPRKVSPRGKRYQAAKEKIEAGKPYFRRKRRRGESRDSYTLEDAIKLVKESSYANFDASVEAHINLGLEADKSEHQIRTSITLPHGTGKKMKVLVFAKDKEAKAASEVGVDEIGDEETIEKIAKNGKVGFDSVVATPEFMPKLAKIARILGPRGLMPSPKLGTVTDKPAEVVAELKKGRVELRMENQPIIHTIVGKVSFPEKNLVENLKAIVEELNRIKPSKVQGEYIKSIYLKSTMGPSVKVSLESLDGGA